MHVITESIDSLGSGLIVSAAATGIIPVKRIMEREE